MMTDADAASLRTERIVFSGRVQGVGFRFTTRTMAKRLPVVGYVRNQPDGTVELVVRGAESAIDELLARISGHFRDNLSRIDRAGICLDEEFSYFEVRY
jgi:acylphosphatase